MERAPVVFILQYKVYAGGMKWNGGMFFSWYNSATEYSKGNIVNVAFNVRHKLIFNLREELSV